MAKSNMSATLLRNIIASKLGCDPTEVVLSGEIASDYVATTSKHTSFNCSWEHETVLYAMYKDSFEVVQEVADHMSTNGHESTHTVGIPLYKVSGIENAILFVEIYSHPEDGEWITEYRVYKPADFKAKLSQVTAKDIARWEQWLKED